MQTICKKSNENVIIFANTDAELVLITSNNQTTDWRKAQKWYFNGKKNECEKFQRAVIEYIIKIKCPITYERFDMRNYNIIYKQYPLKEPDGFEYTEDFDSIVKINTNKYYFNLKFICETGGAQTRSLREVYHFVKCMINYLKIEKTKKIPITTYFINILDGKFCYIHKNKFSYLLDIFKDDINLINKYIFIGDLKEFNNWWTSHTDSKNINVKSIENKHETIDANANENIVQTKGKKVMKLKHKK